MAKLGIEHKNLSTPMFCSHIIDYYFCGVEFILVRAGNV